MNLRTLGFVLMTTVALVVIGLLASCGSGGGNGSSGAVGTGTVNTTISDPATCAAPSGPFSHVWVTVTDVKAHTNANAGDNDSGFVDLTPNLASAPVQVDLLSTATSQCFLAQLGAGTSIPAGNYQQIRVILLDNNASTSISNNQCSGQGFNCVTLTSDGSVHELLLSSESTTGIKIPSGQIGGGGLNVPAGQTANLNIDFNACQSIVLQGNGQYRLKPVLHAGEVSVGASNAVGGAVIDKATGIAIQGGTTVVALEQKDAGGVDRVIMEMLADSSGHFSFCPVPAGTYDVVVSAINGAGVQYAATVTTGVQPGNSLGNIPLIATAPTAAAVLTGQANTAGTSGGTPADVIVSALQQAGSVMVTVPLAQQSDTSVTVTTAAAGTCISGSDCGTYTLNVPAANPNVGAFMSSGTTYTQAAGAVNYTMDAHAVQVGSPSTADCTQPDVQVSVPNVVSGSNPAAPSLNFTGCS